ncbi:MAG: alpha/beta hydrolase [Turicibacter sp.]
MYYKESTIFIKELNRKARLFVGLPDDYETSEKNYPVLYMHDGHNVFTDTDSFHGVSWGLIDSYKVDKTLPEIIVVGLECANGLDRFNEYCPFEITFEAMKEMVGQKEIGGKGDIYLNYLCHVLKPQIDDEYRTLKAPEFTGVMGSSMGGVISLYAALNYHHTFTRIGAVSGAYFVQLEAFLQAIDKSELKSIKKLYMDTGTKENAGGNEEDYIQSNQEIYAALKEKLPANHLRFEMIEGGLHNELAWSKRLPEIIRYLFS